MRIAGRPQSTFRFGLASMMIVIATIGVAMRVGRFAAIVLKDQAPQVAVVLLSFFTMRTAVFLICVGAVVVSLLMLMREDRSS